MKIYRNYSISVSGNLCPEVSISSVSVIVRIIILSREVLASPNMNGKGVNHIETKIALIKHFRFKN